MSSVVVDLTEDDDDVEEQMASNLPPPISDRAAMNAARRILPPSIAGAAAYGAASSSSSSSSSSSAGRSGGSGGIVQLPSKNGGPAVSYSMNQHPLPGHQQRPIQQSAPVNYQQQYYNQPFITVIFSLVNTKEFSVKSEGGQPPLDVMNVIRSCPGFRFDAVTKCIVFPLYHHEALSSALCRSLRCQLERLPQQVIACAQLRNQHEERTGNKGDAEKGKAREEETLKLLRGKGVHESLIQALAPFQREAVRFVVDNDGRALIADEMGLGKTRSAIAAAAVYQDKWPVLVVCPSTARHHWNAELNALLRPLGVKEREICLIENANAGNKLTSSSSSSSSGNLVNLAGGDLYKFVVVSYSLVKAMSVSRERAGTMPSDG